MRSARGFSEKRTGWEGFHLAFIPPLGVCVIQCAGQAPPCSPGFGMPMRHEFESGRNFDLLHKWLRLCRVAEERSDPWRPRQRCLEASVLGKRYDGTLALKREGQPARCEKRRSN